MKKLLFLIKSFSPGIQLLSAPVKESKSCLPLRQLVNQVMTGLLPGNLRQKKFIINEVEKGMLVNNEKNILTDAISRLLSTAVLFTNDNCIHISANLSDNTTWLNITTHDTRPDRDIMNRLRPVKLMTEKIGGSITVSYNKINGTTVAFTFRNRQAA